MSPLEYSLLPVAMFVYSTITMLELPEWPETRGLAVSTSYEDRKYRPFHHSKNQTFNEAGQDAGPLRHFSLQPLWTQLANLTADSLGHGEIAGG